MNLSPPSASRPLRGTDFRSATVSSDVFATPNWTAITCATTGRRAQNSANTVSGAIGANAARARNMGNGFGLLVEPGRTNLSKRSNAVGTTAAAEWSLGTGVSVELATADCLAPDGTSTATKVTYAGGGAAAGMMLQQVPVGAAPAGNRYACSIWLRVSSGTLTLNLATNQSSATGDNFPVVTTSWQRFEVDGAQIDSAAVLLNIHRNTGSNDAQVFYAWGSSCELGRYSASLIPTTTASVARAADVLSVPSPAAVFAGGRFDAQLVVAPGYSSGEHTADHDLLFFHADHRLFLRASDHVLVLRLNAANVVSSALTWSRNQALTIRAVHAAGGRILTVSGASSGNGTATGVASAAISLPATAYLCGDNTGAQEAIDLRSVRLRYVG